MGKAAVASYNQLQTEAESEEFFYNLLLLLQNETSNMLKARERQTRKRNIFLDLARTAVRSRGVIRLNPYWNPPLERVHCTTYPSIMPLATTMGVNDYRNAYGILDEIIEYARCYIESTTDKVIILRKMRTNEIIKIPYLTRFSSKYYSSKAKTLVKLASIERFERGIFMTLTINPHNYSTEYEAKTAITKEVNRLITWIKKDSGILKDWKEEYISVIEFQHNGMPHYHILFFGATWADISRIREQYERYMGRGTFFHIQYVKPIWRDGEDGKIHKTTAVHYLLKYIFKAGKNFIHLALSWALGTRAYNTSRGLIAHIFNRRHRIIQTAKWEYWGAYPADKAKNWITFDDFLADILPSNG